MSFRSVRLSSRPILGLGACALAVLLTTFSMPSRAIEEPDYQVVGEHGDFEVRRYPAYTVAEVVVPGPAEQAGGQGFPILAGYIFGKNRDARKFAMTAPVTQAALPTGPTLSAPAMQTTGAHDYLVQFVLPAGVTPSSAPEPVDPRVRLREIPPGLVAVIRYSGFWSDANYREHLAKLQDAVRNAGLAWTGDAVYARYDAPFTPWFMRRNEIWLRVSGKSE